MISVRRLFLAAITILFGGFNVALAMFRLDRYNDTGLLVAIGIVYFATLVVSTVAFRGLRLPFWVATIVSFIALLIPAFSHIALNDDGIESYDTWYVTAVGLLLSAVAVRGRIWHAIVGAVLFIGEVIWFGGWDYLPKSGISGAVILIVACIAIASGLQRSARDIEIAQAKTSEERMSQEAAATKAESLDYATNVALKSTMPVLKRIADGKVSSKADREKVADFAVRVRDDISGGWLINSRVRKSVAGARARGVDVALLDDGGIETTSREILDELLDVACAALDEINTGRVTIRTQPEESWLIRMTATRPRVVTPDLDLKLGQR